MLRFQDNSPIFFPFFVIFAVFVPVPQAAGKTEQANRLLREKSTEKCIHNGLEVHA